MPDGDALTVSTPRLPPLGLSLGIVVAIGAMAYIFHDAIVAMESFWRAREEYSHGYLIPLVSLFLIWQKRYEVVGRISQGSWAGVLVALAGLMLFIPGYLATVFVLQQIAMVTLLIGLAWSYLGTRGIRPLLAPLGLLYLMIPLPGLILNNLSQDLQLLSSELGVMIIRLAGIDVYLAGNIIDLGAYQLQVVEACDGLRYLFPFMTFGFLAAYLFHAPLWQRAVVFLSTVPLAILLNSLRIGVIGVLVEHFGIAQAEGFTHLFHGWAIFAVCVALLFGEMVLLMRLTGDKRPFRVAFGLDQDPGVPSRDALAQGLGRPFIATLAVILIGAALAAGMQHRDDIVPARTEFSEFPMMLGAWEGRRDVLSEEVLEVLDHPDYLLADYRNGAGGWVNLYMAYYPYRRVGSLFHSPGVCLPGSGWEIERQSLRDLEGLVAGGAPLTVNRLEMQKGDYRTLVYYWYKQRDAHLADEVKVRLALVTDALTKQRTDGALIRLSTVLEPYESWDEADRRLRRFASELVPLVASFAPD